MCSFVRKHLFVCLVNIYYVLGKIPYFIKKSNSRRFDSPIYPHSNVVSHEPLLMILMKGLL